MYPRLVSTYVVIIKTYRVVVSPCVSPVSKYSECSIVGGEIVNQLKLLCANMKTRL